MLEHRDASDRLTFHFDRIDSDRYLSMTKAVVCHFGLVPANKTIAWFGVIFQDFMSGDRVVGLEWDNWSGYIVTAKLPSAEPLVREIAAHIDDHY